MSYKGPTVRLSGKPGKKPSATREPSSPPIIVEPPVPETPSAPAPAQPKPRRKSGAVTTDLTSMNEQVKLAKAQGMNKLVFRQRDFDKLSIDPAHFLWEPQKKEVEPTFHFWYLNFAIHISD